MHIITVKKLRYHLNLLRNNETYTIQKINTDEITKEVENIIREIEKGNNNNSFHFRPSSLSFSKMNIRSYFQNLNSTINWLSDKILLSEYSHFVKEMMPSRPYEIETDPDEENIKQTISSLYDFILWTQSKLIKLKDLDSPLIYDSRKINDTIQIGIASKYDLSEIQLSYTDHNQQSQYKTIPLKKEIQIINLNELNNVNLKYIIQVFAKTTSDKHENFEIATVTLRK